MVSMGIHLHTFVDPCQKLTGGMAKNLSVKTGQSSALKTILLVQILAGLLTLVYHAKYRISMLCYHLISNSEASRAALEG